MEPRGLERRGREVVRRHRLRQRDAKLSARDPGAVVRPISRTCIR
jgi:hypothetical protein